MVPESYLMNGGEPRFKCPCCGKELTPKNTSIATFRYREVINGGVKKNKRVAFVNDHEWKSYVCILCDIKLGLKKVLMYIIPISIIIISYYYHSELTGSGSKILHYLGIGLQILSGYNIISFIVGLLFLRMPFCVMLTGIILSPIIGDYEISPENAVGYSFPKDI